MSGLLWFLLGVVCGAAALIGWFYLALWLEVQREKEQRDAHYGPRDWTDKGVLRRER